MDNETLELIKQANKIFLENHSKTVWFGRCIFLSWYCDLGTCKFCFRSTQKSRIKNALHAKRSLASILTEALIAKKLGWRIEFLTGGYRIFGNDELTEIIRLTSKVYGEKLWINLGAISKKDLLFFKENIKGVVASIETANPLLHQKICPDKPVKEYELMLEGCTNLGLKKSMTIIIGLGETKDDFETLAEFITKHNLERITIYALKPVKDTPYTSGPSTNEYAWWIAKLRIKFPKLQIIAGTTFRRIKETEPGCEKEAYYIMRAGANAITKFPITKKFNSPEAEKIETEIKEAGRVLKGSLTKMPDIDWKSEINYLDIDKELKEQMQETIKNYIKRMA